MDRRRFLELVTAAGGVLAAGIVGVPALLTAIVPSSRRGSGGMWQSLGPLESFPLHEVHTVPLPVERSGWPRRQPGAGVFVWRPGIDEVVVFSRSCTDLACPLNHDPGSGCYFCPCHGGIFDRDGTVMAGPPNRPMQRYAVRLRASQVEVDLTSRPLVD